MAIRDHGMNGVRYRGSIKHKRWRPGGGYGTLCPDWTHRADGRGFSGDPRNHHAADIAVVCGGVIPSQDHAMLRRAGVAAIYDPGAAEVVKQRQVAPERGFIGTN